MNKSNKRNKNFVEKNYEIHSSNFKIRNDCLDQVDWTNDRCEWIERAKRQCKSTSRDWSKSVNQNMSNSITMAEITQWMNTKLNKKKKKERKKRLFKK